MSASPIAYLLCGPSLAGKSTLAREIAARYGARVVSADAINARRGLPFGGEGLPEPVWAETLRQQLVALNDAGAERTAVIVDDTLCYRWLRDRFCGAARAAGLVPQLIVLRPSDGEIVARHAALLRSGERPVLSLARLREHLDAFEWPTSDEEPIDLTSANARACWLGPGDGPDRWLDRWLPSLRERTGGDVASVLDLGCGSGRDALTLTQAALHVVGVDRSAEAIAQARMHVPAAKFHFGDVRAALPTSASTDLAAIVASLSLHYFRWDETAAILQRLHAALRPGGLLLCRLNSTQDHHHGASGHPAIEDDSVGAMGRYVRVDGEAKRFFDRPAIDRLFAPPWRLLGCEELCIARYARPKWVWEVAAERALSA